ncbi:MAG: DUF1127 domain-containing protein, partial [Albidovulum sp.]|uniref:DUF1127 domain-containing protein n=1 Tax=Albidovulum sp. TaxID=1872424 RepID=UPI0013220ADA
TASPARHASIMPSPFGGTGAGSDEGLRAWRLARREARLFALTVRELDDLSDDVLKDIGLVRGSIKATLRERGRG